MIRVTFALAVTAAALAVPAAQAHDPSLRLRGFGTATVDGVRAPGEWEGAAKWDFTANLPLNGTRPATLYGMNDGSNLYLAVEVTRSDLGSSSVTFSFDNDHDAGFYEEGDDALIVNTSIVPFYDGFVTKLPPCDPAYTCIGILDTQLGGTSDGRGIVRNDGTHSFYEVSHPLDTADDGHDFSLRFGKRVGFQMFLQFCQSTCAQTFSPRQGDIVITSNSTVPPETQITAGPSNGSFTTQEAVGVRFTGSDDVVAPEDLEYECNQDGGSFEPCASPFDYVVEHEGAHSFAVRAIDEAGNVDPTPEKRRWTLDTEAPKAPSIRGLRRVKKARVVYRLSATDNVDDPSQLLFRCSVDRHAFKSCPRRLALRVRVGRHTLRVVAVDRARHVSRPTLVRFARARS